MLYTILFHFSVVEVLQLVHEVTDFMWLGLSCDTENNSAGQKVPPPESEGLLPCSQEPAT